MIGINKKYRTRDGREVRIYALDGGGMYPVHGAYKDIETSVWVICKWDRQGRLNVSDFPKDLIEVTPRIKRTVWLNVYEDNTYGPYGTKSNADSLSSYGRIACVKVEIDCEEGEGL